MAVEGGVDDGQPLPVVAVGVSADGVFQHVALEVGLLAQLGQAVFGEGGVPHQFAAGKVVVGVGNQGTEVLDDAPHHRLVDFVGEVVALRTAHIGLHVEKPRDFSPFGQTGLSPLATI